MAIQDEIINRILNGLAEQPAQGPAFGSLAPVSAPAAQPQPAALGGPVAAPSVAPSVAPAAKSSPYMAEPSGFEDFGTFLAGLGSGNGAILPALGGGMKAVSDGKRQRDAMNQTFDLLVKKGIPENEARAMMGNPELLKLGLTNIYAPKTETIAPGAMMVDKATGKVIFDNSQNMKPTNDQLEYQMAKSQGFKGSFMDYITAVKKAGAASTTIKMENTAETEEAKIRGHGLAERFNDIAKDGVEARKDGILFGRMMDLSSNVDPGVKTAIFEELRNMTGIKLDPNADNVQAFTALQNYLAPRMRVPGSGASSDRDVAMFFSALPSLKGSPTGNRLIGETFQGVLEARSAAADIAATYQRGEISAAEADKKLKAIPDPYEKFKKAEEARRLAAAGKLPTVSSPTEALKLGPGKKFIYNGNIMQNPGEEK